MAGDGPKPGPAGTLAANIEGDRYGADDCKKKVKLMGVYFHTTVCDGSGRRGSRKAKKNRAGKRGSAFTNAVCLFPTVYNRIVHLHSNIVHIFSLGLVGRYTQYWARNAARKSDNQIQHSIAGCSSLCHCYFNIFVFLV